MSTLEEAWGPLDRNERERFASRADGSYRRFSNVPEVNGAGAMQGQVQGQVQGQAQQQAQQPQRVYPSRIEQAHRQCATADPQCPQRAWVDPTPRPSGDTRVYVVQPDREREPVFDCAKTFEHVLRCESCSKQLGKYCAAIYAEREQKLQALQATKPAVTTGDWSWLILLVVIVLGFIWLRSSLVAKPTIVRQIGFPQ